MAQVQTDTTETLRYQAARLDEMRGNGTRPVIKPAPPQPQLKPTDIGLFSPKSQTDAYAAMTFIDAIRDAVAHFGEERTLATLRKCCQNETALCWVTGLDDDDRTNLRSTTSAWASLVTRDFMPSLGNGPLLRRSPKAFCSGSI